MKNLNNSARIASSLRRLRESHDFEGNMIASLLGLKEKEYSKLERGSRELNLYQLCVLAEFYNIRKSVILDYGNPKKKETSPEIEALKEEIAVSEEWLSTIMGKIRICEMKLNKKISA